MGVEADKPSLESEPEEERYHSRENTPKGQTTSTIIKMNIAGGDWSVAAI